MKLEGQRSILMEFFTNDQPLGSVDAVDKLSDTDQILYRKYFYSHNYPFEQLKTNPTMIVGRRGSGKTDALLSHRHNEELNRKFNLTIYFEANSFAGLFNTILYRINEQIKFDMPRPLVEKVSDLWSYTFWLVIINKLLDIYTSKSKERELLLKFLDDHGVDRGADPYDVALNTIVQLIRAYEKLDSAEKGIGFFNKFESFIGGEFGYKEAKKSASEILKKEKIRGVVMFDSFEELNVADGEAHLAISGLIRSVARFYAKEVPIQMRCCIPAEAYFYMLDISSNSLKDFQKQIILHWSSMEIMTLCAARFSIYIDLYANQMIGELVNKYDFDDRGDVTRFWLNHLPEKISHYHDTLPEDTIPYLIRHTQLLPRHMLMILNYCIHAHFSKGGEVGEIISEEIIKRSVKEVEAEIATQIIKAYRFIWPEAGKQIENIFKRLGRNTLTVGDLHRIFNKSSIKGTGNIHDISDLLRMLTEVGAVGRYIKETDRYIVAVYEYSEPHRLQISDSDKLCIHPCFSGVMQVHADGNFPSDFKPIYPLGTELHEEDRRVLFD